MSPAQTSGVTEYDAQNRKGVLKSSGKSWIIKSDLLSLVYLSFLLSKICFLQIAVLHCWRPVQFVDFCSSATDGAGDYDFKSYKNHIKEK